jgi:hypothetical protein
MHGGAFWLVLCGYHSWQLTARFAGHFWNGPSKFEMVDADTSLGWSTLRSPGSLDIHIVSCLTWERHHRKNRTKSYMQIYGDNLLPLHPTYWYLIR